jgi:hypothetical protein
MQRGQRDEDEFLAFIPSLRYDEEPIYYLESSVSHRTVQHHSPARSLLICLIVLCLGQIGFAQEKSGRTHTVRYLKSNQTSKRGIGSAKILSGRVAVCHIFCSDSESTWSQQEEDRALRLSQQAFAFIRGESLRHNHLVSFVEQIFDPVKLGEIIPTDAMADPNWTEEVITKASGLSGIDLVLQTKERLKTDSVIVCLHVNKSALSYNLAYYDNVAVKFAAERMVCFTRYPDGRETAAATYAHEILHLYGAGDLYFPYDLSPKRKNLAGRHFPNDVMYRVDYDIGRLDVGPFTAFRIGWTNKLAQKFRAFEDD